MRKTRTRYQAFAISIKPEAERVTLFSHGFIGSLPIDAGNRKVISVGAAWPPLRGSNLTPVGTLFEICIWFTRVAMKSAFLVLGPGQLGCISHKEMSSLPDGRLRSIAMACFTVVPGASDHALLTLIKAAVGWEEAISTRAPIFSRLLAKEQP